MTSSRQRLPSFLGLVDVAAWLAVLGFAAGLLGRFGWIFDLASHFRIQYAATLLVAAALFALARRWRAAGLCLAPGLAISALLAASFFPRPSPPGDPARYRIVSFNVNTANTNHREVLDYLRTQDPDFIFLMEVDPIWIENLRELHTEYPYRIEDPHWDNFGIAAYSKQPFSGPGTAEFGNVGIPMLDVTARMFGTECRLLGVHTLPPMNPEHFQLRNEQLLAAANAAARGRAILLGDFNLTPFSPWHREILNRSGLRDAAAGYGCFPTWAPFHPIFSLPIDHVLVAPPFAVTAFEIGPACGSDHRPLAITLGPRNPVY